MPRGVHASGAGASVLHTGLEAPVDKDVGESRGEGARGGRIIYVYQVGYAQILSWAAAYDNCEN